MDIDKLIQNAGEAPVDRGFSSLMDIDKLIPVLIRCLYPNRFSSLMDIDKLIRRADAGP